MPGTLAAREISKSFGAVQVLDRVSLAVGAGRPRRDRRPERHRQVDAAPRSWPASRSPTAAGSCARGRSATCRRSPRRGPARRCSPTSRGAPASARRATSSTRSARGSATSPSWPRRYADALDRFLALGGGDFDARAGGRARRGRPGGRARRRGRPPLRRRGGPRRARRDPARPLRRLLPRRADEQPRLRRARAARALPGRPAAPASCSSRTTAPSSTAR